MCACVCVCVPENEPTGHGLGVRVFVSMGVCVCLNTMCVDSVSIIMKGNAPNNVCAIVNFNL